MVALQPGSKAKISDLRWRETPGSGFQSACAPVHPDTHTQVELGRWLSIKYLPHKHKEHLDPPPQNPRKILAVMMHAWNPSWGGMTEIVGTHWPISLAKLISFTFTERPFSENKDKEQSRKDTQLQSLTHTIICTHATIM